MRNRAITYRLIGCQAIQSGARHPLPGLMATGLHCSRRYAVSEPGLSLPAFYPSPCASTATNPLTAPGSSALKTLLSLAHLIDWINDRFASIAKWAVVLACVISAGNAVIRYAFDISSNGWLEIQWYLFAACVMMGAAQVLRVNEHVRVDVIYGQFSSRGRVWIDLFGLVCFLLPVMVLMLYYSAPLFLRMYLSQEMSSNAGGLIRWPAMLMLPLGFTLMVLQGLSEIIKRVGWLMHVYDMDLHYERPLQ